MNWLCVSMSDSPFVCLCDGLGFSGLFIDMCQATTALDKIGAQNDVVEKGI